jgi:phospholipid transport system substrate-binding protein
MNIALPGLVAPRLKVALVLLVASWLIAPARADQTPDQAKTFIEALAQQAISTVAGAQLSDAERNDRFRRLFVSSFDLPEISRFVLARYWRSATPEQQQSFLKLFEEMQVLNWAQRFKDYKGENLQVTASAVDPSQSGFVVDSLLNRPSGTPMVVQWRVHQGTDGHLQVTDIVVEGVSMGITQRSEYNSMLQANGGKLDVLLAALGSKVEQLQAAK